MAMNQIDTLSKNYNLTGVKKFSAFYNPNDTRYDIILHYKEWWKFKKVLKFDATCINMEPLNDVLGVTKTMKPKGNSFSLIVSFLKRLNVEQKIIGLTEHNIL